MTDWEPAYLALHRSGELEVRAQTAWRLLSHCELCPHRCGVDRLAGERGICRMGELPKVSSWNLHAWEEPPISGTRGSGTIFFSGCTGRCRFCQNYPISHLGYGQVVSIDRLAAMMLELQRKGAHNINLGLPLVYNTSGYERVEALRLLEGLVEIWLPDAKYADEAVARRLSGFHRYVEHNRAALRELYRQVGPELLLDSQGLARRGLIVRHMILPGDLAGTAQVLAWLARALSPRIHVSLMDQYFPAHRAIGDPVLDRKIRSEEYEAALEAFDAAGLERGWRQGTMEDSEEGSTGL
jgi:putative pyruvate formate lyase activating enzyme